MLKLGLCCGGGACCALASGILWVASAAAVPDKKVDEEPKSSSTSCGTLIAGDTDTDVDLTSDERRVVGFLADIIEAGETPMVSGDVLEQELGLSSEAVERLDTTKLRAGVIAELTRRGVDIASFGGNCSKYSACSVDHNLMNATGEELERYEQEVAVDGTTFANRIAPDFTLPSTLGKSVSLSDHRGSNVALVFLSAHCVHSLDTLPILAELRQKYADQALDILPVFINSGDSEDLASRSWEWDVQYPLLVSEGKEISEAYDSRMVPSTFLIDEQGKLVKQFVGFKDKATLDAAFEELVGARIAQVH